MSDERDWISTKNWGVGVWNGRVMNAVPKQATNAILIRKESSDERRLKTTMRLCGGIWEIDGRFAPSLNKRRAISAVSKQRTNAKRRPYSDTLLYDNQP